MELHSINPLDLLTADEAAAMCGVKPTTIRQWVHQGRLSHVPLPGKGRKLYHRHDVARAEKATRKSAPARNFATAA